MIVLLHLVYGGMLKPNAALILMHLFKGMIAARGDSSPISALCAETTFTVNSFILASLPKLTKVDLPHVSRKACTCHACQVRSGQVIDRQQTQKDREAHSNLALSTFE